MPHVLTRPVRTGSTQTWLRERATVSAVAWEPTGELDCAQWILHGERLGSIGRGIAWWIGDWVNYGNAKFGEKYSRAARITGYDAQTLMNMAYVAARFPQHRRRAALSWSHHAEVSALDTADQDDLLTHAERTKLSVRGLRDEVRARGRRATTRKKKDTVDVVVCPNCGCQVTT
ncbi:hypothetical protein [Actinophytocola gossypii]|uniref:Uncharacterized protein n=1 Tax=Actinophytocola gossypii TaxID=2812003 RepID=A0ABT2JK96_9PSEU|nr:hypothetical protein [Actinophytocola gossypii]MCT2588312.1 hypothetical protein [Actinophytocola gossypii]